MASTYETPTTNVLEISTFCKKHNKQFEIYCKKHDCPCCSKCVVSNHQTCQDLILLEDKVTNIKQSYGLHDIQQTMTDMVDTIQRIKTNRKANLSKLKEERILIEKEIEQTRIKINDQLDKLQVGIMKELYEAESKESEMIGQLLDSIEKKEKEIIAYQNTLINIKQHASDLQTFLAIKEMERDVAEEDQYFTSLVTSNKLNRVSLSYKMNDALQHIFKEIKNFGEVIICTSSFEFVIKKENQAQIVIAPAPSKSINNKSVILQSTIDTKLDYFSGCTLLPDGRMVFSCFNANRVRGFNRNGSLDSDISLQPNTAVDLTYIHDNNTIAVTGGGRSHYISIIDVESRKVKENILSESGNDGIVSRNNTLIYCAQHRGIQMINLSDKSVSNIVTAEMSSFAYVTTFGDKLYNTNNRTNTVTCFDLHGKIQWAFKDESVLINPQGISVDNTGNVYVVVGRTSRIVIVISPDGQRHRQLLSNMDGLYAPKVLHYNRSTNQLLVANMKGKAFLYKVE